jgi:hypothetical protein
VSVYISPRTAAMDAWRAIQGDPFVVTFITSRGVTIPAQTIQISYEKVSRDANSDAGAGDIRPLALFGVRGHPTQPDTVLKDGYRFVYADREYTVQDVVLLPGEIQARGLAVG